MEIDVVVIGAGAAGIAAARTLHDRRLSVAVVEARDRVGGRAWTYRFGEHPLDLGAGHLHSADENDWAKIAPRLGFTVDQRPPSWARPAFQGNFPLAEQEDYWAAWERFYARIDARSRQHAAAWRISSSRAGAGIALLGAMATYINGAPFSELVVREYALYRDTGLNQRIREGYGALIAAYAAGLDIRLNCPVTLIDHAGGARADRHAARGDLRARRDRRGAARHHRERDAALFARAARQARSRREAAARRRRQGLSQRRSRRRPAGRDAAVRRNDAGPRPAATRCARSAGR